MRIRAQVCRLGGQAVNMTWSARLHHPAERFDAWAESGVVVAAAVLIIAAPVATWWLVGDQSTVQVSADYAFQPLDVSVGAERASGVGSKVLAAVA